MDTPTSPVITGVHHVCLTVTDLDASMNWYQQLFQAERWPGRLPHYAREETGFAEMLAVAVCYHSDTPDRTSKELPGRQQRLNAKVRRRVLYRDGFERMNAIGADGTGLEPLCGVYCGGRGDASRLDHKACRARGPGGTGNGRS
jgi:catechol 2,3-dioxygenase-like lactoylglutathione lyase family enzyme